MEFRFVSFNYNLHLDDQEHWSDGAMTPDDLQFLTSYAVCAHCMQVYAVKLLNEIDEQIAKQQEAMLSPTAQEKITYYEKPSLKNAFRALSANNTKLGNELSFRLWLWRESNTDYRDNPYTQFSAPRIDNMRVLVTMLEHSGSENETELRAELYRQLGQFKEALATLANSKDNVYTRATRKFSEQQSIEIVKVDPQEDRPDPKPNKQPGVYFEADCSTVIAYPGGCVKTKLSDGSRSIRSKRGHEMDIDHRGEVSYRTIHA
ncbi:hypothetical protein AAOGI_24200 [Agarivorans albus]